MKKRLSFPAALLPYIDILKWCDDKIKEQLGFNQSLYNK